jgi:predicted DNA-binding transcriptional regulator AlpA
MPTKTKYLHVKQLAAEWEQHPATIYRKVAAGQIPGAFRLGGPGSAIRIDAAELEKWLHEERLAADGTALVARSSHSGGEGLG